MAHRKGALLAAGMLAMGFAGGMVASLLTGGSAALAQEGGALPIRVQSVTIVDADGRERGAFGMLPDGPGLALKDEEGRTRIVLAYTKTDPEDYWSIRFLDAKGVSRIGWGARGDGRGSGGHMMDSKGVLRVGFGADEVAGTGLSLKNADGNEIVGLGVGPGAGGGDLTLKSPSDGREVWRASKAAEGAYSAAPAKP
jgi:hypothetical protein